MTAFLRRTAVALVGLGAVVAVAATGVSRAVRPPAPLAPGGTSAGGAGPGWTFTDHRITVGGTKRDFLVARPVGRTGGPLPVLVVLHGRHMAPRQMALVSGFPAVVGKAIIVYPAGLGASWNAGECCGPAHVLKANDVQFLSDVVSNVLSTQRDASSASVFLVGYSNGGRMAYQMACLRPGLFAAVAVVEALPAGPCSQTAPVPLLVVASTGDPFVHPIGPRPHLIGGYAEPTLNEVIRTWQTRDGCSNFGTTTISGQLTATTWASCSSGARVTLAVYAGNRHQWPAGNRTTPSAQVASWAFFRHPGTRVAPSAAPAT